MKEVFDKCYFCHAELRLEYNQTVINSYAKFEFVIKNQPSLACTKCTYSFAAEPYQSEKTDIFMKFLKSIGLKKAEIEYKDMMRYVDNVLKLDPD